MRNHWRYCWISFCSHSIVVGNCGVSGSHQVFSNGGMKCFVNSRFLSVVCGRVTLSCRNNLSRQVTLPCSFGRRVSVLTIRCCQDNRSQDVSSNRYLLDRRNFVKALLAVYLASSVPAFPAKADHNFKLTGQYEQGKRTIVFVA